jgi:aminopeptidase N
MSIRVRIKNVIKYGQNIRLILYVFHTVSKPDLINVDGDKILLCEKTEHKTLDNYIFQYKNAGLYLDRREAIDFAARNQSDDP